MSNFSDLAQKVTELYKEIVTTSVQFEGLRRETTSTITEFKSAVQRFDDKMQQMHLDHVRERAALESQIKALEARLNALSEGALHAVAREAARQTMESLVSTHGASDADLRLGTSES